MLDVRLIQSQSPELSTVEIFTGEVVIQREQHREVGVVSLRLKWAPSPQIEVEILGETARIDDFRQLLAGHSPVIFEIDGKPFEVSMRRMQIGSTFEWGGQLQRPFDFGALDKAQSIEFLVPNLHEYLDSEQPGSFDKRSTLRWSDRDYDLTISPLDDQTRRQNVLKHSGFAFTHYGTLQRNDGSQLDSSAARQIVLDLWMAMWFMRGLATTAVFPTAYDKHGTAIWSQIAPWDIDYHRATFSWADRHHTKDWETVWKNLSHADSELKDALDFAIRCYARSNINSAGLSEVSITLTQTALDRIAWHHFRIDKAQSRSSVKSKSTAERIAALMKDLVIPIETPGHFTHLHSIDGEWPDAVSKVRNDFVHPERRADIKASEYGNVVFQAWRVSTWALELAILAKLEYKGVYNNRCSENPRVGVVESVPWV